MDHGHEEKALHTLAKLHSNGDVLDPFVRGEFDSIQGSIAEEHELEAKSYMQLLRNKSSFRRLLIGVALQASGQMTGVSAIQYFSPTIFAKIGEHPLLQRADRSPC